ncbi:hypothetical protein L6164_026894 [Bauhinia variegata]|uniref:Uncharacterized protein n=1 Tax=Bauhinia variegata TaxID=167791 RepID=A0ACB9LR62_BAUVA|nr:hypothetical protein L6164_026894 [Bauhinia variegata]
MNDPSYYQYVPHQSYPPLPPVVQHPPPSVGPWSTGILDCHQDYRNCCFTLWCPCIAFGRIAEILDEGQTSCRFNGFIYAMLTFMAMPCTISCLYRTKLRQRYLLEEKPFNDCFIHCLCELCSLCQEYRELQNRGVEMSLGWEGNMEMARRTTAMQPAPVDGGMVR